MGTSNSTCSHTLAALLAMVGMASCGGGDADVSSWATQVEELRTAAVHALEFDEQREARVLLERAVAMDPPSGAGPVVAALRQDAHFALGRLHFDAGRFEQALEQADRGIALSPPEEATLFLANLHALRALALEGLSRAPDALDSYEAALRIHQLLFERTLREHDQAGDR